MFCPKTSSLPETGEPAVGVPPAAAGQTFDLQAVTPIISALGPADGARTSSGG